MTQPTIDTDVALSDLTGTTCKGCGTNKACGVSFCRRCYRALPPAMRSRLYHLIGNGYEQAYTEALNRLQAAKR